MNTRMTDRVRYRQSLHVYIGVLTLLLAGDCAESQGEELTVPVVVDGETQIVPELKRPDQWIRHDLWVETEFDSDGDGKLDRMHVDVTRPRQTENLHAPTCSQCC